MNGLNVNHFYNGKSNYLKHIADDFEDTEKDLNNFFQSCAEVSKFTETLFVCNNIGIHYSNLGRK